ncbi:MAG: ATP-binding cassette domain-containing protein [Ignavibacteriae bacterium]|nr:ATP-binding cassette domain-containing protein [Ignavibacteriota bacterium]
MRLIAENISKVYQKKFWGLKDFSMDIDSKRIGILGPYGSGKSTLVHILTTVTKPTKGTVTLNGTDISQSPDELRSHLGYMPQNFGVYSTLTALEYLEYIAALKGKNRKFNHDNIIELMELMKLTEVRKQILGTLSPGMRQNLGIAQMFLNDPKLFVVDELSDELLPEERHDVLRILSERSQGKLLFITTERASDLEGLVDEIYILSNGSLLTKTTPDEMKQIVKGKVWEMTVPNSQLSAVRRRFFTVGLEHTRQGDTIRVISDESPGESALNVTPTLNDVYQYVLHIWKGSIQ